MPRHKTTQELAEIKRDLDAGMTKIELITSSGTIQKAAAAPSGSIAAAIAELEERRDKINAAIATLKEL